MLKNASEPEVSSSTRDDHVRQPVTKLSPLVWGLGRQQFDGYAAQSSAGSLSSASASSFPEEWWRKNSNNVADSMGGLRATHHTQTVSMFPERRSILDWDNTSDKWKEHAFHETATSRGVHGRVPVFVMLPLDSVNMNNTLNRRRALNASLMALKSAGIEGIMMDVWWGIVEKDAPLNYNWSAYRELIEMARKHGLKVQAVMSFHQCGGNVGDSCNIPLPPWVLEEIQKNPDLAYTDKSGRRNAEYICLGADNVPALKGRTPVQCYADFMRSFRDNFEDLLGDVIIEIQCGMGPAGELRYPSYPESEGRWRFPGIGEFQCYDKYMLAGLKASAEAVGMPAWGTSGPHDAGNYNQWPDDTGFFRKDGTWSTDYGQFFMEWYSEMLLAHGERILSVATGIFRDTEAVISGKVAGIHWHYGTRSHAAELTAGYYNTRTRDGYAPIAQLFAKYGVTLNFTCFEMRDLEQPSHALCSPEGLVKQVAFATRTAGTPMAGENALPRFDSSAHEQIITSSRLRMPVEGDCHQDYEPMAAFTFLRMSESMFHSENWRLFVPFVRHMEEGRTFQPWEEEHQRTETHVKATGPLVQEAASLMLH